MEDFTLWKQFYSLLVFPLKAWRIWVTLCGNENKTWLNSKPVLFKWS